MIAQLPLPMRWPRHQRFDGFHVGANAVAVESLRKSASQMATPWIYLAGPSGSGKTHLLMAACYAASAAGRRVQYLSLAGLARPAAALRGMAGSEWVALDNLQAIAGERAAEHALFDLYNEARSEQVRLLFADRDMPTQLGLSLPDLRSRLSACVRFNLKPLDEAERRQLLLKRAADRGISLDEPVLDWLFNHHTRDLAALLQLLDRMDEASLAAQRRVTVPFVRALIQHDTPKS